MNMAATKTVVLFDVDGTLITSGGTGRRALVRAFERVYGRADACDAFSFAGMTDRGIFRKGLAAIDVEPTPDRIEALLEDYLGFLGHEVASAPVYRVHDGILGALEACAAAPDLALGLGTGNVERGARTKLARVDLNPWFSFGGYGSDAEDRAELIGVGARRGADALRAPFDACRVVIVGDTPKDVAAAHAVGGQCVAVSTGGASFDDLVACGADWVFEDLTAPGAVDAILGKQVPQTPVAKT